MIVRQLTPSGDFTFGAGKNNYLSKNDAIGQSIKTRLSSFLGNCFFDIQAGIDWFNLLGSNQVKTLQTNIATVILNTENVTGIVQLNVFLSATRQLAVSYQVSTVYTGLVPTQGLVSTTTNYLLTQSGQVITTQGGDPIII